MKVRSTEKIRVLVADPDGLTGRRIYDFLNQNGFECRMASFGSDVKRILVGWKPRILLIDLLLPDGNAFEILKYLHNESSLTEHPCSVMIMSSHNTAQNVQESYERGASDYLARPIMFRDLLARVVFNCRAPREVDKTSQKDAVHLADLMVSQALKQASLEENLFALTKMATLKMKGLRCSVIRQITHEKGVVLASNDKKDIAGFNIDLKKYPEIQLVANTGKPVVIDNLSESKALSRIKSEFKDINFNSIVVCPLYYRHKIFGVLSMRMPTECTKVDDQDVHFLELLAKIISLYLGSIDPEWIGRYGLLST